MRQDSILRFHDLSIHKRGTDYVVGYEPARAYITVDEEGLAIIKDLQHRPVGEVQARHKKKDVKAIITQLAENHLVHKIGHRVITPKTPVQDILSVPAADLSWTHHPLTRGTALGICTVTLILFITQPDLLPRASWFFATEWLSVLIPGAFIIAWILHLLHELGHYAAIRGTGHPTGFHLVHRWHLLVPAADLKNVKLLTPPQQTRVYLAGLAVDVTILFLALVYIMLGVAIGFWQLVALITWLSMLVQVLPLAYTDVAKIAERITGKKNVLWHARQSLKSFCLFCTDKDTTHQALRANLLPWMITGIFLGVTIVLVYFIPLLYELFTQAASRMLIAAHTGQTPLLVDSVIALLLLAIFVSLYAVSALREHHLATRRWFVWLALLLFVTANFTVVFLIGIVLSVMTSPLAATVGFLLLGVVFGSLFLSLMDHLEIEKKGFATDTFLPVYAASTALLLVLLFAAVPGAHQAETLFGIAYAVGMLASLAS